ncbi:DUF2948 family protein [Kordiimonas pumila]|uniref:DUF2948 family protein n=1 Tax=Kordiimonas pumila TaxID=2161677 RepID=A0ABV7D096_9PROT|nr:DUF2948 family protein [Kordiimonas pumila]
MNKPLKLIAQSADDLTVISALLQDMTIRVGDIAWLPAEKRLACIGNRFVWEKKRLFRRPKGERIRTAFHFRGVEKLQYQNIDITNSESILSLLNIEATETEKSTQIVLNFSGGSSLAITAEVIDCVAADVSDTWQAIARPHHA